MMEANSVLSAHYFSLIFFISSIICANILISIKATM